MQLVILTWVCFVLCCIERKAPWKKGISFYGVTLFSPVKRCRHVAKSETAESWKMDFNQALALKPVTSLSLLTQVQFCQGKHRNSILFHTGDGFFYTVCLTQGAKSYLRCVDHRSGCPAKAFINRTVGTFHTYNLHTHGPDLLRIPILAERQGILNEAANLQQYATLKEVFDNLE